MKKLIALSLILSISFSLVSCKSASQPAASDKTKLMVSATFDAMAEFVTAVGQEKVEVSTIVPAGMEPHEFEPKAADIAKLSNAQVFVYNGIGMETWAEKAIESANSENLVVVIASDHANLIKTTTEEEFEEHGSYDPHLWLSIKGAQVEIQNIADGLSNADPRNKIFYQTNAQDYIDQLEDLFEEYSKKFSSLNNKNFITGHAAFQYFCDDFNLAQKSVEDVFAEGEPSPQQLAKLVDYCKENNVTTIFAESMASPDISQTLANEVNAVVETIYTMESAEDEMTYLERMEDNCEKIYASLSR